MSTENCGVSLVTVHEAWGEADAELIRALLAANGVETVCSKFPQSVYPMTVDGLGRIEIQVAAPERDRAAAIIAAHVTESD